MNRIRAAAIPKFASGLIVFIMIFGLVAVACGSSDDDASGGQPTSTAVEPTSTATADESIPEPTRIDPPALNEAETEALVEGINAFAGDFYQAVVAEEDGNLVYSPFSIALAFSMVYAGAKGDTEMEIADVLGFLPQETQHLAANSLEAYLSSLGEDAPTTDEEEGDPFQLSIANSVWGQQDFLFLDAFLQTLAEHYGAELELVDFIRDAEAARTAINDWIAEATEGRITDIIPEGAITDLTRLVLANAIYFKAAWLFPFEEDNTRDGTFTLLDGSQIDTPMMSNMLPLPYLQGDGFQAVSLPYAGEEVAMTIVVPDAGRFEEVEAGMSGEFFGELATATTTSEVVLTMPRFDFESDLDLNDLLPGMGMTVPFDESEADFSGISEAADLFISAAIHSANITVDEEGTEAAAVTVIIVGTTSAGPEPVQLTIDRPFIFAITERETDAILFMGRVVNPAG